MALVRIVPKISFPRRLHKGRLSSATIFFITAVLIILICNYFLLHSTSQTLRVLESTSEKVRARLLYASLQRWYTGPFPSRVVLAAGACTPRDVADAILRDMNADDGVIDVGANRGYPVSRLALTRSAPWLLSVEPDARNFATLSKLKRDKRTRYLAVNGAASSEKGEAEIAFHKDRDDFTCFHCLDKSKAEVSTKKVHVYTVTELVARLHPQVLLKSTSGSSKGVRILLFKTDTQGHEGSVLIGAREVMGFVRNVLMEFDPKLLRSKENAMAVMKELFDARFECVQLKFAGKLTEGYVSSFQGRRVISRGTAGEFYDSVVKSGAYTDVFCSKR